MTTNQFPLIGSPLLAREVRGHRAALYALLADVQAGARPAPASFGDVQPLLPALEWPNETAPA